MLMRTKANTPAFLCGVMASHAAMHGGLTTARSFVDAHLATPAGFLVHNGKQLVLPTMVCQGCAEQAASLLAAMLDSDPDKFCCATCGTTLMTFERTSEKPDGVWGTSSFVAFDCNHAFHPACIEAHYQEKGHCCPLCPKSYAQELSEKFVRHMM
jgi:hypothetical protein